MIGSATTPAVRGRTEPDAAAAGGKDRLPPGRRLVIPRARPATDMTGPAAMAGNRPVSGPVLIGSGPAAINDLEASGSGPAATAAPVLLATRVRLLVAASMRIADPARTAPGRNRGPGRIDRPGRIGRPGRIERTERDRTSLGQLSSDRTSPDQAIGAARTIAEAVGNVPATTNPPGNRSSKTGDSKTGDSKEASSKAASSSKIGRNSADAPARTFLETMRIDGKTARLANPALPV